MTRGKYRNHTFEELIHDQGFVEKIKSLTSKSEWQKFLKDNHNSKEKILQAKKFILLFSVAEGHLQSDKKHELWSKIRVFNNVYKNSFQTKKLKKAFRIAASVLIVLSLSSILYLTFNNRESQYVFSEAKNISDQINPILTLANGVKIEVQKDESQITVLEKENTVQINNDTIHSTKSATISTDKETLLNELVIPFGKKTIVVLNDGTKVWLNAGSKFAFPQRFTGKKRKVFLDGEGYFEVAKNKEQPFIISSKNINIEVLGTKFNVSAYSTDELCETVLLEGSVNVWSENKLIKDKIRMSPNQKATYNVAEDQMVVESEPEAENYIAWIEGWYKFSNENIEQVLLKVGRFYNVTFQYESKKIKKALPISGKLDLQESFDEVMQTLSKVAEIEYKIEGKKIIIN